MLTREKILTDLQNVLEPLSYVQALWQGGAAAFARVDQWSDIDLQVAAADDRITEVVGLVESTLPPFDLKYEIPQPAWHGHWQAFYRFKDVSPFLMLDLVVMKTSAQRKFLEPEIHGQAVVHFDKTGFTKVPALDRAALEQRLQNRLQTLRVTFPLFQPLVLKEVHRHNAIEALAFYQSFVLRPLVEVLRIKYAPTRFDFHTRYVYYDLPAPIVQRLTPLFFVANEEALAQGQATAAKWFAELMDEGTIS